MAVLENLMIISEPDAWCGFQKTHHPIGKKEVFFHHLSFFSQN